MLAQGAITDVLGRIHINATWETRKTAIKDAFFKDSVGSLIIPWKFKKSPPPMPCKMSHLNNEATMQEDSSGGMWWAQFSGKEGLWLPVPSVCGMACMAFSLLCTQTEKRIYWKGALPSISSKAQGLFSPWHTQITLAPCILCHCIIIVGQLDKSCDSRWGHPTSWRIYEQQC